MNNTIGIINSFLSSSNIDNFEDIIIESIYNSIIDDNISLIPLTEAAEIIDISEWGPLIESVEVINNTEKQLKSLSDEKDDEKKVSLFKQLIESLRKLYQWWYKIEPNKKYKTLHIVLHILLKLLIIYISYSNFGKVQLAKKIEEKLPAKLIYDGSNKLLIYLFGKNRIGLNIIKSIYRSILGVLQKINDKQEEKVNLKNIDKSIAECEKTIEIIDKKIENAYDKVEYDELVKTKIDVTNTLAQLTKFKDAHNK